MEPTDAQSRPGAAGTGPGPPDGLPPSGEQPGGAAASAAGPEAVEPRETVVPRAGTHRPAARILCLDAADRLLLLHWRDPHDGGLLWEPPGGGVEPGETPLDAARRELAEETGLKGAAVQDRSVPVPRDVRWNGRHYTGSESFFLARFPEDRPPLTRGGMLPDERAALQGHAWMPWRDLAKLPDPVEPPALLDVLRALAPQGPWSS